MSKWNNCIVLVRYVSRWAWLSRLCAKTMKATSLNGGNQSTGNTIILCQHGDSKISRRMLHGGKRLYLRNRRSSTSEAIIIISVTTHFPSLDSVRGRFCDVVDPDLFFFVTAWSKNIPLFSHSSARRSETAEHLFSVLQKLGWSTVRFEVLGWSARIQKVKRTSFLLPPTYCSSRKNSWKTNTWRLALCFIEHSLPCPETT